MCSFGHGQYSLHVTRDGMPYLIGDVFLVEPVDLNLLLAMASLEQLDKVLGELVAVVVDEFLGIFTNNEHLSNMALALHVHFEGIGVSHLPLTDLTVPSQPLESFGLELVAQVLGRAKLGFGHRIGGRKSLGDMGSAVRGTAKDTMRCHADGRIACRLKLRWMGEDNLRNEAARAKASRCLSYQVGGATPLAGAER
jgi:hypothetical protein